jgi:hypothetical protein
LENATELKPRRLAVPGAPKECKAPFNMGIYPVVRVHVMIESVLTEMS